MTVSESDGPGHAEELSRKALRNGAESILVAAGDATINEVVNGFFEDDEPVAKMPHLGIIPTKAGGDFRRTVGMSDHLMEAVGRIGKNEPKPLDLGRVVTADGKSRYFANVCSAGISAEISRANRKAQWLNVIGNDLAFNWSVLRSTLTYKRFPLLVSIPGGPQSLRWDANCVAICNGQSFGGGIKVTHDADYSDGYLDVIIVHDYDKAEFLKGLKDLREDDSTEINDGISTIRTTSVLLSCDDLDRKIPVDMDGEFAGMFASSF